jgi:hypothetical protein
MDEESKLGMMEANIKENTSKDSKTASENIYGRMETAMKETGKKTNFQAWEQ